MAYQQAVEERLAERRARHALAERAGEPEESVLEFADVEVGEPEVNVEDLQEQAAAWCVLRLATAALIGLWITWADVLPALNGLNEVVLWTTLGERDGVDAKVAVTLVDLAMSLLMAALAWVGAKNIPGAMELVVLNRLELDAGAKYAFTTLVRYVFAGIGITSVFGLLGMEWSRLQWLVAALSVGLGFGLQEIVANFVSGIILLFERPIRIGDVVTVNGSTGTVLRMQIRATTLLDFDNKELIMPNKVFITGEVLNWTLSDHATRLMVNVGIAYGDDPKLAMDIMLSVAQEHPDVLSEPVPQATFDSFGE